MAEPNEEMQEESVVEAQAASMSTVARMVGVVLSPAKTFADIRLKPNILIPLILVIIVGFGTSMSMKPYIMNSERVEDGIEKLMERANLSREQAVEQMEKQIAWSLPIGSVLGGPIMMLIVAGILMLCGNFIMGGETNFKTMFSLVTYSSIIGLIGGLLKLPLIIAKESIDIVTSLAIFMPVDSSDSALFKILSAFEVFAIWESVVVAIGLTAIYQWTQKKAYTLVIALWAIGLTIYGIVLAVF